MLDRQREFVADASHELRTPLTSVLANLELFDRRARAVTRPRRPRRPCARPGGCVVWSETSSCWLGPTPVTISLAGPPTCRRGRWWRQPPSWGRWPIATSSRSVDRARRWSQGVRDELHRLILNLLENALRHTPPGTYVHASVTRAGDEVVMRGRRQRSHGIPAELASRVFDRFVRNGRDGGKGSGTRSGDRALGRYSPTAGPSSSSRFVRR